jgi:hypothetical protein
LQLKDLSAIGPLAQHGADSRPGAIGSVIVPFETEAGPANDSALSFEASLFTRVVS